MPPPPGTLSTITCLPMASPRYCARMRPSTSTGPPAANGTTMVTGRVGHSCACATDVATSAASASAAIGAPVLGICSSMNFLIALGGVISYRGVGSLGATKSPTRPWRPRRSRQETLGTGVSDGGVVEFRALAGAVDADPRAERGASLGRDLSHAGHHDHHAVCGRQRDRRGRAHDRAISAGRARPVGRDRESRRRRRIARSQCRRAGKARRLHALLHHQFDSLGRERPVQERALRSDQGFHADRAHRKLPVLRRRQSSVAGQFDRRPGGLCQGQSGQALLRGRQLDRAYCRRDDQEAHRHRYRAGELPQQSGGGHRSHRRPYSDGDPGFQHRSCRSSRRRRSARSRC